MMSTYNEDPPSPDEMILYIFAAVFIVFGSAGFIWRLFLYLNK